MLEGSESADEDQEGCHKREWLFFPYYTSFFPCPGHGTRFSLAKHDSAWHGHGSLYTCLWSGEVQVTTQATIGCVLWHLRRHSHISEARVGFVAMLRLIYSCFVQEFAHVFLIGGKSKASLTRPWLSPHAGFQDRLLGSNTL